MNEELVDIVDNNDKVIGTAPRSKVFRNKDLINRLVVIILARDDGKVLLHQRSFNKKEKPGIWIASAAGHVSAGEKPFDAANRELNEELGIEVGLSLVDKFLRENKKDKMYVHLYSGAITKDLKINYDKSEIEKVEFMNLMDIEALRKKDIISETTYKYSKQLLPRG